MFGNEELAPYRNPTGLAEARERCAPLAAEPAAAAGLLLHETPPRERSLLPYQEGHLRKGFRAPTEPEYCFPAQANWLRSIVQAVAPYHCDLEFLLTRAARASWSPQEAVAVLLASMIEHQRKQHQGVRETLVEIVAGRHASAPVDRYVISALLCTTFGDWEAVVRRLVAAQRQERLRQSILESADLAHPRACTMMLHAIDEHDITRFAAVARAASVRFGLPFDSADGKTLTPLLREVASYLVEPATLAAAVESPHGQSLYLLL